MSMSPTLNMLTENTNPSLIRWEQVQGEVMSDEMSRFVDSVNAKEFDEA